VESGRAAEAIPHLLAIRTAAAQAQLGRAYLETDQPAKAIGPLRAGLVTDADGSLHFQLARALQRTGAAAQAREMDRMSQEIRQQRAREQEALGAVTITPP
jgi:Tfp pilus assembly protein PilF